ncbi:MAG: tyrosine-type recombinase/integrase [Betaproteobacteria bacterium]
MPTNNLTDAKCKSARPAEKDYKLFDGGGLHLFVTAKGAKTWRLAYRVDGKQKTMSFGPYPQVSLAEARKKRDDAKGEIRAGDDPMAPRRAKKQAVTFADSVADFWAGRKDVSPSYRQNALRGLEMHLLPNLGGRAVSEISRDDLLTELKRMDAAGKHVYVRKVRMWADQVFDWAVENGFCELNPAALIKPDKAFGRAVVENFAALDLRDVPDFLGRLSIERDLQSVIACRLLAYTWVRTNELRMAEWSEIDLSSALWIVPAGKMKRKRDHVVPLSSQAVKLISEMRSRCRGDRFVFESDRAKDRPMSENAILYLIHRMGYKGRMTGHGWRSVASTWANERGYNPDAIERQLAHVPDNKIRAVYNRAEYLPERRTMLQAWADWLDSCEVDSGIAKR